MALVIDNNGMLVPDFFLSLKCSGEEEVNE